MILLLCQKMPSGHFFLIVISDYKKTMKILIEQGLPFFVDFC